MCDEVKTEVKGGTVNKSKLNLRQANSPDYLLGDVEVKAPPTVLSMRLTKGIGEVVVYAKVASRSRAGETHNVVFLKSFGWLCGCENFLFTRFAVGESCAHIDAVQDKAHEAVAAAFAGIQKLGLLL